MKWTGPGVDVHVADLGQEHLGVLCRRRIERMGEAMSLGLRPAVATW